MYGYNRENLFLSGVLCGTVIGTLTTLLFTTQKGKKIQSKIVDTYEDLEENMKQGLHHSKEKMAESTGKIKEAGENIKKKLTSSDDNKKDH